MTFISQILGGTLDVWETKEVLRDDTQQIPQKHVGTATHNSVNILDLILSSEDDLERDVGTFSK